MNNSTLRSEFKGSCFKQEDKVPFTLNNVVSFYIAYELDTWSKDLNVDFTYSETNYSGYEIGFDSRSLFSISHFDWGKNVITFIVNMSSSVHSDNKNKSIFVLVKGPTQVLDNTT